MSTLLFTLTLTAPALFPRGDGDPNTVDSWGYIPGSALLGALATRWLQEQGESVQTGQGQSIPDPAVHPTFRRLFLSGEVRYLHAYPAPQGLRLLPSPRSLATLKGQTEPAWDAAALPERAEEDSIGFDDASDEQRAAFTPTFLSWAGQTLSAYSTPLQRQLHHTWDRQERRPAADQLYQLESIPAGTVFQGALLIQKTEDEATLEALLQAAPLRLGRARSAEYSGMAKVSEVRVLPRWEEVSSPTPAEQPDEPPETLVITLLSDYIGRDAHGTQTPSALQEELQGALKLSEPLELLKSFTATTRLEGYVSVWHMPRPPVQALAAGSVLVFRRPAGLPQALEEALDQGTPRTFGLGERQAEGYGRLALGWHGLASGPLKVTPHQPRSPAAPPTAQSLPLRLRLLEQHLLNQLPALSDVDRAIKPLNRLPDPSTLAALRTWAVGELQTQARHLRLGLPLPPPLALLEFSARLQRQGSRYGWSQAMVHEAKSCRVELPFFQPARLTLFKLLWMLVQPRAEAEGAGWTSPSGRSERSAAPTLGPSTAAEPSSLGPLLQQVLLGSLKLPAFLEGLELTEKEERRLTQPLLLELLDQLLRRAQEHT